MYGYYSATKTQSHQDDMIFSTGFDNRRIAIAFSLVDKKK